jgi:capsular exopolysaccharide synthesis family protein
MSDPSKPRRSSSAESPSPGTGSAGRSAPPLTYQTDQDVHILDRLAVLYRYRRVAGVVFVLTTIALMIQGYSNVRLFQAQARILIEDERSTAMPGISENAYYEDPLPYYQTQYRILKGRDLTRRVVKRIKLGEVPEFNGTATPPSTPSVVIRSVLSRVAGLLRPARPAIEPEAPKVDETADESALVSAFLSRVEVIPVPDSRLVDVTFTSTSPQLAADAINALVDEYVAQNLEVKLQSTQNMLDWLEKEVGTQQQKVEDSERQLANYRDRENAMSLDDKNNIVVSRLNALNDAVLRARTTRIEKEAQFNQVRSMTPGATADSIAVVSQNPQIQAGKVQLAELQRQKAQLSEKYGEKHPEILRVNAQLADAQRQLDLETTKALQSVQNEYERARLEERTLSAGLEDAKRDAQDLGRKSVSYNVMEREARSNRTVYESLLQRANELRVSSNSRANNVRVIDHAEVPKGPITPTGRRTWLLAIAVGLAAAVGVAYGLDYMNDTIKTPEDVTRYLKMTFLGLVPAVPGHKHPVLASSHSPHDFGEAFRSLRTSIISRYPGEGAKTMVVTSAQPLEGKTTTACNIAMALAYGGARVLLIDADMRRPGMHRPLRLNNERGLSQILTGQARVRDVIQRTVDPNLLAITAGKTPPNPSELLASERMNTLLTNLSHGPFDWIVVDTPPVLAVTDAVILAPAVTGVTFVVGAEMTRRRLAERALETILASHPKMVGVVLNKVDFARNRYYYSRYYGHQYKNYYAEAV